jgi:prepilin-type N-terminal cleavage/methylation domain-containing protein
MAQKYMILKVITQNFSKVNKSSKGFTLIELIVGLSIMLIVGGLAMNALVQSSISFNKDKKSIDSSQSVSAILDIIGNDIKQSGENINDKNFPTIEFITVDTEDTTIPVNIRPKAGSSKIIIRRALTEPLTLCEAIPAASDPTTRTSIVVADNTPATVTASANCDVGTSSSKLVAARPATEYELILTPTPTDPVPSPSLATSDIILPKALRKVRDYRCQLDDPNPTVAYDAVSRATDTFCGSPTPSLEKIRIAVSNESGQFLIFNQTNETLGATGFTNTATSKKYSIAVNTTGLDANAVTRNTTNKAATYAIKSPIYVIEERIYTLSKDGYLQLSINGATPQTLTKKIENFIVSAKTYTNSTDRIINPTPAGATVNPVATSTTTLTTANPICYSPTTPAASVTNPQATDASETNPQYICKFNYFTGVAATDKADWKTLAGIKVEIQTKYDGNGQDAEATNSAQVIESKKKLYAASEFFPRNVLSK